MYILILHQLYCTHDDPDDNASNADDQQPRKHFIHPIHPPELTKLERKHGIEPDSDDQGDTVEDGPPEEVKHSFVVAQKCRISDYIHNAGDIDDGEHIRPFAGNELHAPVEEVVRDIEEEKVEKNAECIPSPFSFSLFWLRR